MGQPCKTCRIFPDEQHGSTPDPDRAGSLCFRTNNTKKLLGSWLQVRTVQDPYVSGRTTRNNSWAVGSRSGRCRIPDSVSIWLCSPPPYVAELASPKHLDRHFVAVDWARMIFSTPGQAVNCRAHFCATATSNLAWVSVCHSWVLIWASEAPQRPLRGPSWVSIWASEAWVSI